MATDTKKEKIAKPVPMELTELKNGIKGIEQGIKRIEEVGKQVSELKEQADTFLENNELVNKDNYPEASRLVSLLRTTRTSLDSERKTAVAPLNNAVKYYNSLYNKNIEDIKEAEAKVKPLKDVYDKEEDDRKEKIKQEKEKAFVEKIQTITDLGAQLIDGWYVIKSPDGDEDKDISYQAAELRTISDENWEKVKKLANQFKVEAQQRAEAERKEAEEKENKRLADEQKLKDEKKALEQEKLRMKKEILEMLGFKEESEHFTFHSLKYSKAEIIEMDSDTFSGIKLKVAEVKSQIEKEEKITRVTTQLQALGFYRSGNEFIYTKEGFKHTVLIEVLESEKIYEHEIAEFNKALAEHTTKASIAKERHDKLGALGFVLGDNIYLFTRPGFKHEIPADNFEVEQDVFEKRISDFTVSYGNYCSEQAKIATLKEQRGSRLSNVGMKYDYVGEAFSYTKEYPNLKEDSAKVISISMAHVITLDDAEFDTNVTLLGKQIEEDKVGKIAYDKEQAELKKSEEAELKSDTENITAYFTMIKDEANKVVIKDESVRKMLLEGVDLLVSNPLYGIS